MNLNEAITHAEEVENRLSSDCKSKECGAEHVQLANWLKDYNSLKTRYQYLASDFSNYKRRTEEKLSTIKKEANKDLILKFLNIVDDMNRLMIQCYLNDLSYNPRDNIDVITSGFQLIYENLIKVLESEGCTQIDVSYGDKFNPEFHEAISTRDIRDDEDYNSGDICEIYQSGWMFNENLLRPVKVVVCN